MVLFLDALSLLARVSFVPTFNVWIVGGSDSETTFVRSLVSPRPEISDWIRTGRLTLWGRCETTALPELYARSFVVVMPSSREQFGIVAVEAMMCGCPVIATAVGGLPDVVIHGYTGTIVDPDSAAALANALLGYLRSPDRRHREGACARRWALRAFSRERVYESFPALYRNTVPPRTAVDRADLRREEAEALRSRVSELLGEPATVEDLSSSVHTSARIDTPTRRLFCKWYRPERSDHVSVLPVPAALRRERRLEDYIAKLAFHAAHNLAPKVLRYPDKEAPIAIFEWCRPLSADNDVRRRALRQIAVGFRAFRLLDRDNPACLQYLDAVRDVIARQTLDAIDRHDLAAARLNTTTFNAPPRFQQVHPFVELIRMRLLMREGAWGLSSEASQRFDSAASFLLDGSEPSEEWPRVCHGSLKPVHLLIDEGGRTVACDVDGSRYVVGPFDEVHDVWYQVKGSRSFGASSALSALASMLDDHNERKLAVAWLLVYVIFHALLRATNGWAGRLEPAMSFCRELPYAYNRVVTQSRESATAHSGPEDGV
jgi:hypothetical protein